jgi:HPr kinase/phosphorylase
MRVPGQFHGQIHASCVARGEAGVLLLGPPGSGKSDLALRLLDHGFSLVADDRVDIEEGMARPPQGLAGLLEVRGLGIVSLPHAEATRLVLAVALAGDVPRLPAPAREERFGLPLISVDPASPGAPARVALALDCALGHVRMVSGAFAP